MWSVGPVSLLPFCFPPSHCIIVYSLAQPDFDPTPALSRISIRCILKAISLDHISVCLHGSFGASGDERCAISALTLLVYYHAESKDIRVSTLETHSNPINTSLNQTLMWRLETQLNECHIRTSPSEWNLLLSYLLSFGRYINNATR